MGIVSFTPVKTDPQTLELFLKGLDSQALDERWFADDNDNPESSALLNGRVLQKVDPALPAGEYQDHNWTWPVIARVSGMKNDAITRFLRSGFDHLFLVDSDVLMPPGLVEHLVESEWPVISAVYWTEWPNGTTGPNVWDYHPYRHKDIEQYRKPGHYMVGGLGACTLIRRDVLQAGVSFDAIPGVADWEDRQFCIRASVLGVPLTACTHLDLFHVYRSSDLPKAKEWADVHYLHELSS